MGNVPGVSASLPMPELDGGSQNVRQTRSSLRRGFTVCHGKDSFPVRTTRNEERMLRKRVEAAVSHAMDPDKLPVRPLKRPKNQISLKATASSNKGQRPANEDEHVIVQTKYGNLFAICDGHGLVDKSKLQLNLPQIGQEFARTVAKSIETYLAQLIENHCFDATRAFEKWAETIHTNLPKKVAGTTAVIGFLEKINHYLHVACIGDSKIVVFRKKDGLLYPIPTTSEINWSTPECVERVKKIVPPEVFKEWLKKPTKDRRFPPSAGVNLSNSLGDHLMTYKGQTAITHRPECSLLQVEEGDLIVLGCDGLFDFVTLEELIEEILKLHWNDQKINLAQVIADYALHKKKSTDNVTVITIRVNPATSNLQVQSSQSSSTQTLTPPLPN